MSEKFNPYIEDPEFRKFYREQVLNTRTPDVMEAHNKDLEQAIATIRESLGIKPGDDKEIDIFIENLRLEWSYYLAIETAPEIFLNF